MTYEELLNEYNNLRYKLEEAEDTIEAIRTGKVDALVVKDEKGHQLYTLNSADQSYRVFIEKMTEGAVTLNEEGVIIYSNTRFATMLNLPLSKVIGARFGDFIDDSCHAQLAHMLLHANEQDYKDEIILNNSSSTAVLLSLTALENNGSLSVNLILTDLTLQKEHQQLLKIKNEELEYINRALEVSNNDLLQFASVASHDLQEPLRKIEVFSSLLSIREAANISEESTLYLNKILMSSERMKKLIIDILNYSRLSADNNYSDEVDLNQVINDLLSDYEILIKEKNAVINVGKLPYIEVDKGQIRQVFQNMLSNALKFNKKDSYPLISIEARRVCAKAFDSEAQPDGPYCIITIKDNGIGFDEKYVNNIFALFERLNPKNEYEGSGIGLSIAKRIIEKHNGLITANSREGAGSEFMILLPLVRSSDKTIKGIPQHEKNKNTIS